MKRSEMLKKIESLLDAGRDWADLATRADNLLCHLEQDGMLPPNSGPGGYDEGPVDSIIAFHCKWDEEVKNET